MQFTAIEPKSNAEIIPCSLSGQLQNPAVVVQHKMELTVRWKNK